MGLYGSNGIIPLVDFFANVQLEGWQRLTTLPTLLWFAHSDAVLLGLPLLAVLLSVLLVLGRRMTTPCLVALWVIYLSLVNAGPVFMQFQWDILLLETGLLAIVLRRFPHLGVWLYRWLLFRFMWLSGWVKVASGDALWRDWSALTRTL